jgi:putative heme-binding domain-containing protein
LSYRRYKPADAARIADVCLGIPEEEAADFLLEHIQASPKAERVGEYVRHASRHAGAEGAEKLAKFVRATFAENVDEQLAFFRAVQEGSAQRGAELGKEARMWGRELAGRLLDSASGEAQPWWNVPLPEARVPANPWFLQQRPSSDGDRDGAFLCSLPPGGEHLTGVLRSRPFEVPARLTFFLAGHDGAPSAPPQGRNLVRLVAEEGGAVLAEARPPRDDVARKIEWNLAEHAGSMARLELVDGDAGPSYAWLAAGRFEPEVAPLPKVSPSQISARVRAAAEIAKSQQAAIFAPAMARLLGADLVDDEAQAALAGALAALEPTPERSMLAPVLADASVPAALRRQVGRALAEGKAGAGADVVAEAMKQAPARVQQRLALNLAGSGAGVEMLLGLAEKGQASPRLFQDAAVQTKISAGAPAAIKERVARLTENLEPASDVLDKQIEQIRSAFDPAKASAARGAQVHAQFCAVCHQIDNTGAVIGPQLDGIGGRGLERIVEDIVDPNRNVDINFRTHALITNEGDVVTGLLRREEGELVVLADATGKEIAVPKSAIDSRREAETSIMPGNFADVIPESDLQDLLAFLLSKG